MKVLKSFARKKNFYVRKKRIKYRRYAVKKIHILSRKIEEKESMRKHFKVKKNEDQSKVRVTQRSSVQIISRLFQVITATRDASLSPESREKRITIRIPTRFCDPGNQTGSKGKARERSSKIKIVEHVRDPFYPFFFSFFLNH